MKLEPIIQSEVSQKDKDHYSILTHIDIYIYGNWKDGNDNPISNDIIKKNAYSWLCCQKWEELPFKNSSEVLPIQACTTIQQQANKLRDRMLEQGIVT